jgi:hypothetical protein
LIFFSSPKSTPTDSVYIKIYSTSAAFVALKADGLITAWGDSGFGGAKATEFE